MSNLECLSVARFTRNRYIDFKRPMDAYKIHLYASLYAWTLYFPSKWLLFTVENRTAICPFIYMVSFTFVFLHFLLFCKWARRSLRITVRCWNDKLSKSKSTTFIVFFQRFYLEWNEMICSNIVSNVHYTHKIRIISYYLYDDIHDV